MVHDFVQLNCVIFSNSWIFKNDHMKIKIQTNKYILLLKLAILNFIC